MSACLDETIAEYRAQHGEPTYRYFKKWVVWEKFRRRPGGHVTPIGDGQEVTQAEYESNVTEGERLRGEAFMGRCQHSYWQYHRKMVKDGWREVLIKDVQAVANGQQVTK